MPDKPTHEQLLNGEVNTVSWLNEQIPIDFTINFAVEPLSAIEIARQRWRTAEILSEGDARD